MKESNTVIVHGKLENGTINVGDKLAMPTGAPAKFLKF
jgi:hypothetical protein